MMSDGDLEVERTSARFHNGGQVFFCVAHE